MDFESIYEAFENGELEMSTAELTNVVVAATTKKDVIDCDMLQEIITALQSVKKTATNGVGSIEPYIGEP